MSSVLADLRAACPPRSLSPSEARLVAERQASKLLRRMEVTEPPVPEQVIDNVPRVEVRFRKASRLSGTTKWSGGRWLILINATDTWGRQRFSLAHEFKHLLDWPLASRIYRDGRRSGHFQGERAADWFAAALWMPRPWVKRAFYNDRIRDEHELARRFQVSVAAMRVRIDELGLYEPRKVAA